MPQRQSLEAPRADKALTAAALTQAPVETPDPAEDQLTAALQQAMEQHHVGARLQRQVEVGQLAVAAGAGAHRAALAQAVPQAGTLVGFHDVHFSYGAEPVLRGVSL